MRILWVSNHPENKSGYGGQTRQVAKRLMRDHELVLQSNFGQAGMIARWNNVPVFGGGRDQYSRDVIGETFKRSGSDVAITLYDAWVYEERGEGNDPFRDIPAAGWLPVDHAPAPQHVLKWASRHYTIAMSRFGQKMFADAGIESRYVPHAVEDDVRPTDTSAAFPDGVRKALGVPEDAFLVTVVSANVGTLSHDRKSWGEMLQALGLFVQKHTDVFVYLHTEQMGPGGVPLPVLVTMIPGLAERVRWADQWGLAQGLLSDADMAAVYTASDVLLGTSRGEGFQVPLIEAQACGTPVIASDFTASAENVGAGWKVPVQPEFDWKQGSFFGIPVIGDIVAALGQAYAAKGSADLRAQALAFATQFRADHVYDTHWRPVLADLARLAEERKPKAPVNTAIRPNPKKRKKAA